MTIVMFYLRFQEYLNRLEPLFTALKFTAAYLPYPFWKKMFNSNLVMNKGIYWLNKSNVYNKYGT
jgi:hypothetical protein